MGMVGWLEVLVIALRHAEEKAFAQRLQGAPVTMPKELNPISVFALRLRGKGPRASWLGA